MNPNQDNKPPTPHPSTRTDEENAAYAQALIEMVNFDYAKQHPEKAKSSFLSTKQIIFFAIIIILTLVISVAASKVTKTSGSNSSTSSGTSQTKQLVHSVQTFDNPSSY
jgi:cytoskeletal protein RodZ